MVVIAMVTIATTCCHSNFNHRPKITDLQCIMVNKLPLINSLLCKRIHIIEIIISFPTIVAIIVYTMCILPQC